MNAWPSSNTSIVTNWAVCMDLHRENRTLIALITAAMCPTSSQLGNWITCCVWSAFCTAATFTETGSRASRSLSCSTRLRFFLNKLHRLFHGCYIIRTYAQTNEYSPSVMVEWLTLLLRIREVPSSKLGPMTGYLDWGFSWFYSAPEGKILGKYFKIRPRPLTLNTFSNHNSPITSSFDAI
jgi:hypothetical protein